MKITEDITFLFYFISLFNNFLLTLTDLQCKTQGDCNDGKSIHCGICTNDNSLKVRKCIFPFPYMFEDSSKCLNLTSCDNNCNNHGSCIIGRALPSLTRHIKDYVFLPTYCECADGFFGRICEYATPKSVTVKSANFLEQIITTQNPFVQTQRSIIFTCYDKNVIVSTETESGNDEVYFDIWSINIKECAGDSGGFYAHSRSRFPYIPFNQETNNKILSFGNEVLGYLSNIKMKLMVNGVINYECNRVVFVSYQETNLVCNPVVKLSGCDPNRNYENIFVRSNSIKISSHVIYISDGRYVSTSEQKPGCQKDSKYNWKIYDSKQNPLFEYHEIKDLSFNPYSLNFQKYTVLLEVTSMLDKPSQNFAYCYFSVKFIPLVAVIEGSSERTVTKHYGLILSTSRSLDKNMPPEKQGHMHASWSCLDISKSEQICDPSLALPVSNVYIVPSERLSYNTVYKITLKVWTNYYESCSNCGKVEPVFDYAMITVANKSDEQLYMFIQCVLNCNKNVINNQQLYLRVKGNIDSKDEFKWTYYEKGQSTEQDTKNLTVEGLPSFMFVMKENTFGSGKSYVIVVRNINKQWSAQYGFETEQVEFDGDCTIKPDSGTKGLSLFEIVCQNFTSSPIFEFYDKTPEEAKAGVIFSGRMLGTSSGQAAGLKDFRATRGQIIVYIIDNSGLYTQKVFPIDLLPMNVTTSILDQIFLNLTDLLNQGESAKMLEYTSSVPDIISSDFDKKEILDKLLQFITLVPTDSLDKIKLTTSTLTNVLLNLNKPVQLAIEPELMRDTLHIVRNQTYTFEGIVSRATDLRGMSPQEIRLVASYQLNCLHSALMCKDPRTVGITEFDYDLKTLDDLMDSSKFAEDAISLIKDILTLIQAPGLPPTKVSTIRDSYTLWVVKNDEEYNLTNYLHPDGEIPLSISNKHIDEFETALRKDHEELAVRVARLDENIFWWSKSDIQSNLLSVSLAKQSKSKNLERIRYVKNEVGMLINLTSGLNFTLVSGIAMPYKDSKTNECTLEKDLTIAIHRLDPEPLSLMSLKFLFPPTNGSLRVHVERNYRPDCDLMRKSAITINEEHSTYGSIIYHSEEPSFYFVGIKPEYNVSVAYTFEVKTTVCKFWAEGHWSSKGCKISQRTSNLEAHCKSDHFSIFGAAFPVPPQEIDLFSDISLFLTVFENPIVVSFVSVVLIIYFICCFWAWRKDKKDKFLKNVIILDDNFPEDRFPYLMAVYTSSRFNAGTSAHVGIQIRGSLASSRPHILSSKERKVLKRNYDDWFVLYCPEPLGDLLSIHLWHDNSGSSPDWFCDKVIVYDLENSAEIVFVVEEWIALRLTYFPEATVKGASVSQLNNVKRMFLDNCILGFREYHTLLCIISRHPRSEISRLQRISVLMCCLMAAMLCSIMFYSPVIDDHEYKVGSRDFFISLQSLIIASITTFVVLFSFKKSYKYKDFKNKSTIQYGPSGYTEYDKSVYWYSNFVQFVSKTMKGQPLIPAQLEGSESVLVVRKNWRSIAWVLCVGVIMICSFFIMLYGLKLGLVKSKVWLSSVLFTLSEDFFVSTPLRIIFFSIILSITFQKTCEMDNHQIDARDMLSIKQQTNEGYIEKLLIKRRHQMYAPLRADFRNEMLRKKELWNNWWTVIDFSVALLFIFVVSTVVFELWSSHYYNNSRVMKIITQSEGSESFLSFRNTSQVNNFLKDSLLRSLYITFWYNKYPIKEKDVEREYWAEDFTHTIVGHQRYRQLRVLPIECRFTFLNTSRKCLPHYNDVTEDREDYGPRWKPAHWRDVQQSDSPWKYTDKSRSRYSTLYRLGGKSGVVFHNGGYLTDLGPTKIEAYEKGEIVSEEWQDQLTRAVFVEFTVYNINVNLFSQVTMIVEYLISGSIQLKAQVVSVESRMKLSFWNALYVVFIVYYVIRSGYLINRQGLVEYLSTSSRNRSRLFIVFLGGLSILVAAIHFFSSTDYYKSFINRGYGDTYFEFDIFIYYFIQLQVILSFLLAVAIFRTILIFRGGRTLLNYFYTFTISIRWIFWLTLVIFVFLLVQLPLIILLKVFSFYNVEEIVLNLKFTQYLKSQSSELKYLQIFLYVKCIVVNVLLCFYILIFLHYFRIAKTYKMKKSDKFNIALFVLNKIYKPTVYANKL